MKKIRWFTLLFSALLLAGCGGEAINGPKINAKDYNLSSMGIFATSPSVLTLRGSKILDVWQDEKIKQWNAYMSDKYNTNVFIKYEGSPSDQDVSIRLQNASQIFQDIRAGAALPLEEYLKDNPNWNRLPEEFRKRFEYDGHIYAIPKSSKTTLKVSSIRTDWLKQAGKTLPYTTDELMEAGKAFGSGKVLIGTDYALNIDLFNAFGVYFSDVSKPEISNFGKIIKTGYVPIAYDPELDCFAEGLFKPGMEEAVRYFQEMYDSGLISKDAFWGNNAENVNSGLYGLVYGDVGYAKYRIDEAYEALPPLSEEHPVTYSYDDEGYTVNPITENPGEAVNLFVDMMFGSVKNYLDFACGVPDTYKIGSNSIVTIQYLDAANKSLPVLLDLADFDELMLGENSVIVTPGQDAKAELKTQQQIRTYERDYIDKYTAKGSLVRIPVWYSVIENYTYSGLYPLTVQAFNGVMLTLINPNEKALNKLTAYRTAVVDEQIKDPKFNPLSPPVYIKYPQMMKEINALIGKEWKQEIG